MHPAGATVTRHGHGPPHADASFAADASFQAAFELPAIRLPAADTMAAARELALAAGPDVTSMQDVPELVQLWQLAIGAGFLEAAAHRGTFRTGAAADRWRHGTEAEALAIWSGALMFTATHQLDIEAGLDVRRGRKLGGPEGGLAHLTPLGSWAVREQLAGAGVQIPLLPPPAEMTAADLVAAAQGADSDEIAVGAPGVATLPGTRPEADDVAWLITDLLAAAAQALEPADLAIQLGEAVPEGAEEMMFGVMSRLPHPDAARVLTMIGQHHPEEDVARAARRAAHQVSESIS